MNRRKWATLASGLLAAPALHAADDAPKAPAAKPPAGPSEAPFARDYPEPKFKPAWKKPQLNRQLAQDFVILAHSELELTKKLVEREPKLALAAIDWGGGDFETGLGGAAHMGRRDIVELLLANGARLDIFCAAMLGLTEAVRAFLKVEPKLIDAPGPHGFTLHFHAQVGGKQAAATLDYLQSVKKLELKTPPFMMKGKGAKKA
jgi:hypothetical protein